MRRVYVNIESHKTCVIWLRKRNCVCVPHRKLDQFVGFVEIQQECATNKQCKQQHEQQWKQECKINHVEPKVAKLILMMLLVRTSVETHVGIVIEGSW